MKLYILNDDINTFEYVAECVNTHLRYPYLQCVSIVNIISDTGECMVKESADDLLIQNTYDELIKDGLKLRMES